MPDATQGARVFLSYQHGHEPFAELVRNMLRARGAVITEPDLRAGPIADAVATAIRQSDLVIVLPGTADVSSSLAYELGLARGVGKTVLVVLPPHTLRRPWFEGDVLTVRATAENDNAIRLALDRALADAGEPAKERPHRRGTPSGSRTAPIGTLADQLLALVEGTPNEIVMVSVLQQALEASGLQLARESLYLTTGERALRPDLVTWIEELDSRIGNPVVIEVTTRRPDQNLVGGLEAYLDATGASMALLVRAKENEPRLWSLSGDRRIIELSLIGLLRQLRVSSIAAVLNDTLDTLDDLARRKIHLPEAHAT